MLRGNLDVRRRTARLWDGDVLCLETVEMKRNRAFHRSLNFVASIACGNAARKVGRVRGESGIRLLDHNQVFHCLNPACSRNNVGASSLLSHGVERVANSRSHCVTTVPRRSPRGRPQKRPHEIPNAANCSENGSSEPTPSLPWAQGVAGSNPVAPTNRIRVLTVLDSLRCRQLQLHLNDARKRVLRLEICMSIAPLQRRS